MKTSIYLTLVLANLALVLVVVNGAILKKQAVVDSGRPVFLGLAPVDPRSLMQGDYMRLAYGFSRDESFRKSMRATTQTRGRILLELDAQGIARFSRVMVDGDRPAENEVPLQYRKFRRGYRFGIESYFFQEGFGEAYESAKFAEVRISPKGEAVLVDLRGPELATIDPTRWPPDAPPE